MKKTFQVRIILQGVFGSPINLRVNKGREGGGGVGAPSHFPNLGGNYIPNLSLLVCLESFEKFLWWWWWVSSCEFRGAVIIKNVPKFGKSP